MFLRPEESTVVLCVFFRPCYKAPRHSISEPKIPVLMYLKTAPNRFFTLLSASRYAAISLLFFILYASAFGQEAWQPTKSPTGYEVLFLSSQDKALWAGFGGLGLFYSPDEGQTWIERGDSVVNPFPTALLAHGKFLYASTLFGGVYRSADAGLTWSAVNKGLGSLHVLCLASLDKSLYAGTSQGLFTSEDSGESWAKAPLPYPHGPHQIIFSLLAYDKQILAGSSGAVYVGGSKNGEWSQIILPTLLMIQTMLPLGKTVLMGSSGDGIFLSQDTKVWAKNETLNAALANQNISALAYGPDSTAATASAGENAVYYKDKYLNEALPREGFRSLALHEKTLYGGTYSKGVWKYGPLPKEKATAASLGQLEVPSLKPVYTIFPNPSPQQFAVEYLVQTMGRVRIELFSSKGEKLFTLADQVQGPGAYSVEAAAGKLPPGAYFCVLQLDGKIFFERLVIAR